MKAVVQASRDPLRFYLNAWRRHGDMVRFEALGKRCYLAVHPEAVRHVLLDNASNYRKPAFVLKPLRLLFGKVVTTEGETWRELRRWVQLPLLGSAVQAAWKAPVVQAVNETLSEWEGKPKDEVVDVCEEVMALALRTMCYALFGCENRLDFHVFVGAIRTVLHSICYRVRWPLRPPLWFPSRSNRQVLCARRTLEESITGLLRDYRASSPANNGLLSGLLASQPASVRGEADERQLREMLLTLLVGAAESVGIALCWAWVLTARHPAAERKLLEELEAAPSTLSPGRQGPAEAPYARMILRETLRLYPPTWLPPRQAVADDTLQGFSVPRGTVIVLSQYLTHRHPDFWDAPEEFLPERFASESLSEKSERAYFPFGLGSHQCAGMRFALFVGPLLLSELVRRYRLELVSNGVPEAKRGSFFLEPAGTVGAILRRRTHPGGAAGGSRTRAEKLVVP